MGDRGALRGRVVVEQRGGELGPLARRPPQDRVDEAGGVGGARRALTELDRLVDGGMVGSRVAEEQLEEAEAQGGEDRRVEALGGPLASRAIAASVVARRWTAP